MNNTLSLFNIHYRTTSVEATPIRILRNTERRIFTKAPARSLFSPELDVR